MTEPWQTDLLKLLVEREALRFGDFTLKSGRKSPYFVNAGRFASGGDLARLGAIYGAVIEQRFGTDIDLIFGPAYKGIPLGVATAMALESRWGKPVGWAFDRKEAKTHGDGGNFVGTALSEQRKLVVVDDVLTAGTALRETLARLSDLPVQVVGAVVAVDRQEKGQGEASAREELATQLGLPVEPVLTISEAVEALRSHGLPGLPPLADAEADRILQHISG